MRLLTILLLLLSGPITAAWAQPPLAPLWRQQYFPTQFPDVSTVVKCTTGGYVLIGFYGPNQTSATSKVRLVRTNHQGDTTWTKQFSTSLSSLALSTELPDFKIHAAEDAQGAVVVAASNGVIKCSALGDTLWTRRFSFTASTPSLIQPSEIFVAPDGNYVMTYTEHTARLGQAVTHQAIKLSANSGQTIWSQDLLPLSVSPFRFRNCLAQRAGGYALLVAEHATFPNKLLLISEAGSAMSKPLPQVLDQGAFLMHSSPDGTVVLAGHRGAARLAATGDTIWTRLTTSSFTPLRYLQFINEDSQGNIILTSFYEYIGQGTRTQDQYITRFNRTGRVVDSRRLLPTKPRNTRANACVFPTSTGSYVIGGNLDELTLMEVQSWAPLSQQPALNGKAQHALQVYPNPATGPAVSVTLPAVAEEGQLQLLDSFGRILWQQNSAGGKAVNVPLTQLPSGLYLLQYNTPHGKWVGRMARP
ncbi:T9SS type A sorting domain-containing protein [Hymenobacter sp. B81]|uniref:T9SS type A sorting domain-containing protein n=1 Tax=Hymenobacter sp. B81 TaxID=3344878 RepID=UPI0037DDAE76